MKFKDDEKRVLLILAGYDQSTPANDRYQSILNKFTACGLIDAKRQLTPAGQRIAAKFSAAIPAKKKEHHGKRKRSENRKTVSDVHRQEKSEVDVAVGPDPDRGDSESARSEPS